jgi:copper homeostasis protein|tara:strand:- start:133 stop:885 length:753 start_codon:yes stop_codon:yes gene_type:complete
MSETPRHILLEACVCSVSDAVSAVEHGADRLELNVAIELGGLTPTVGLLQQVKEAVDVPVLAMVRPRAGGFRYSTGEQRLMRRDAHALLKDGADGIVVGAMTQLGTVDVRLMQNLKVACGARDLVFHMAFDSLPDREAAIEDLIRCGVCRVLTSGGCKTAFEGSAVISELQTFANDRLEILPGGGVTAENVRSLIQLTGCRQVHGSFKVLKHDPAGPVCCSTYPALNVDHIRAVRTELDRMANGESECGV